MTAIAAAIVCCACIAGMVYEETHGVEGSEVLCIGAFIAFLVVLFS